MKAQGKDKKCYQAGDRLPENQTEIKAEEMGDILQNPGWCSFLLSHQMLGTSSEDDFPAEPWIEAISATSPGKGLCHAGGLPEGVTIKKRRSKLT